MIDQTSATLGAHGARLDQLDRDHAETRRRMDALADAVQRGDQRLADRMDAVTKEMRDGFAAIALRLDAITPETLTLSIGKGRRTWNTTIVTGIAVLILLGVLDKMGFNTQPARDLISAAHGQTISAPPSPLDIDGDALRGTLP